MLYKFNISEFITPSYAIFRIPCKWNQIAMWLQRTQSFQYETCNYIYSKGILRYQSFQSFFLSYSRIKRNTYCWLLNYFITLYKSNIQNIKLRNLKYNIILKKIDIFNFKYIFEHFFYTTCLTRSYNLKP